MGETSRTTAFCAYFLVGILAVSAVFAAVPLSARAQPSPEERARLQAEYDRLQGEIAELEREIKALRAQVNDFQSNVDLLNAQIKRAEAEIRSRNNEIARLAGEINQREERISDLESRLARGRESLAKLMREKHMSDNRSLAVLMLSSGSFSDFFANTEAVDSINRDLLALFEELRGVREETEREKQILAAQRDREYSARYKVETERERVARLEAEQKRLRDAAAKEQASYQQVLAERRVRAEAIRAALFELRDAEAIPFGAALQFAEVASAKTGVRPALILAILEQESRLGANVGTCTIVDLESGQTRSINSGRVFHNGIHPTRDLPLLQVIVGALGRDLLQTRVSCPLSVGYGGAMGPAQFIPSTWNTILPSLRQATGKQMPDPWDPSDAIMASALLLRDLMGTTGDRIVDERTAACRYYSGRTCYTNGIANAGLSYGNQVMEKARAHQNTIDFLKSI